MSVTIASRWRERAACLDEDPELFFSVGTTGPALDQIERAKAVCALCPVRPDCLEWALQTRQDAGVWGGLDEEERRRICRARSRASRNSRLKTCGRCGVTKARSEFSHVAGRPDRLTAVCAACQTQPGDGR